MSRRRRPCFLLGRRSCKAAGEEVAQQRAENLHRRLPLPAHGRRAGACVATAGPRTQHKRPTSSGLSRARPAMICACQRFAAATVGSARFAASRSMLALTLSRLLVQIAPQLGAVLVPMRQRFRRHSRRFRTATSAARESSFAPGRPWQCDAWQPAAAHRPPHPQADRHRPDAPAHQRTAPAPA